MKTLKRYTVIFCSILLFISQGCKNKNNQDVISPMLYQQNDSISNALNFIEVPEDKKETYLITAQNNGELVSGDLLKFANKYFSLGTNKDSKLYISMLSEKTKEILEDDSKNGILLYNINKIKEGLFINSKNDNKYLAITSTVTSDLQNRLRRANFTEMPTHRIIFYYFNSPKYMLMGSSMYFVEEDGTYKIVTETMSKEEAAIKLTTSEKKDETKEYGIISSQETKDEESGSIKYSFDISVDPNITGNNTFAILKLTENISEQDNNDISPEITEKALIDKELFEKYKDKQLRFKYSIEYAIKEFKTSSPNISSTSWIYAINIASQSESSTMQHLGQSVIDVLPNKDGGFIDSDLELLSYETEQSGQKYKNRIILRKTPIDKSSD